jgi:hypothetical protein
MRAHATELRFPRTKSSKTTAPVGQPDISLGDSWTYAERRGDGNALKSTWSNDVVAIDDSRVEILSLDVTSDTSRGDYTAWYDGQWNLVSESRPSGGRTISFEPALVSLPFPLEPGKSWRQVVTVNDSATGKSITWNVYGEMQGWERVKVTAGEFDAIKIVKRIELGHAGLPGSETRRSEVDWYAPVAKSIVRHEQSEEYYQGSQDRLTLGGDRIVRELVAYTLRD